MIMIFVKSFLEVKVNYQIIKIMNTDHSLGEKLFVYLSLFVFIILFQRTLSTMDCVSLVTSIVIASLHRIKLIWRQKMPNHIDSKKV